MPGMILVIGGTGFIGRALVRHLVESDYPVRLLIHPSPHTPDLPRGVPVEIAVSSLTDERGLRSAMVGVTAQGRFPLAPGSYRLDEPLLLTDGRLEAHLSAGSLTVAPGRLEYVPPTKRQADPRAPYLLLGGLVLLTWVLLRRARHQVRPR